MAAGGGGGGGGSIRAVSYGARAETDSLEALTRRLTADMRDNIRSLVSGCVVAVVCVCVVAAGWLPPTPRVPAPRTPAPQHLHPVLSPAWREQADKLNRLAGISQMERSLTKTRGVEVKGTAGETTLWEGEELAMRYLLEDGKLNLCVRMVDDYLAGLAALTSSAGIITVRPVVLLL